MANHLITENDVKEYLGISDFRHASKDVLVKFVSSIPYINNDVAVKIIEQYPTYSTCAQAFVKHYTNLYDSMLKDNSACVEAAMKGYQTALESISEIAQLDNDSDEDRRLYAEKMVLIADKMAALDADNKTYNESISRFVGGLIAVCLFIGASMLGVNIRGIRVPHL